jgi:outer membrane protein TolC
MAAAGLVAALLGSVAWPASAETLEEALAQAYTTNPVLDAQRASLRATDELVSQAVSGWRPTVQVAGQAGAEQSDSNRLSDTQNLNPTSIQLQASQPLFRGFRTMNSTSQAENTVLSGRAQLEASNDRFRVGEITRTDVAQSEAAVSGAISAVSQAEANLTASRAAYQRIVGKWPENLTPPPALPKVPPSEDEARSIALSDNPSLAASRLAELASADAVKVAKGALLPTASLVGSVARFEEQSVEGDQLDTASITAQVQVPLYQSGAEYSQIREAQEQHSQSRIEIANAERKVVEGVATSWELLRAATAVIVSSRDQIRANEIALDGVRQEAAVGSRTTLDVLDAEQTLLDSRVRLVRAQREEMVAAYQVLAAIGRLNAVSLKLPVQIYDPTANYNEVRDQWIGIKDNPQDDEGVLP